MSDQSHEAAPVGRYSVGLVPDGTGYCVLLDGVECGGQWSGNDAETIVRALNAAMLAGAAQAKPAAAAAPSLWMRGDFLGVTDAAHVADRWRSEGYIVTAYAKVVVEMAQPGNAASTALLTDEERKAIGGVMVNAEHDAIDVEDACPGIEVNEDAYWAWHTYHGLKKLLATGDRHGALEASLKLERECHALSYRNATALGERVHRLECAIRAISASLRSGGAGHDLDENDPVILELREQITRLTQGGGLIPSNDALQDGLDAAKNAGAEGVDIGVIADIFNSVQAAAVAERNKDAGGA